MKRHEWKEEESITFIRQMRRKKCRSNSNEGEFVERVEL